MKENEVIPVPADLLLQAHRHGVTVSQNGKGGLLLSPSRLVTPEIFYGARRVKPQLLALVSKLEAVGADDDALILEALALFNVKPESIEARTRIPADARQR